MKQSHIPGVYLALCGTVLLGQQAGIAWGHIECYHCLWIDDIEDPAFSLPECRPKFNPLRLTKEKCPMGCMTAVMYGINNGGTISERKLQDIDVVLNSSSSDSQGQFHRNMAVHKGSTLYRGCSNEEIQPGWESTCRDFSLKNDDQYKFKRVCYCTTNLCNDQFAVRASSSGIKHITTLDALSSLWVVAITTILVGNALSSLLEFHYK